MNARYAESSNQAKGTKAKNFKKIFFGFGLGP
jgi:hypothetical protein